MIEELHPLAITDLFSLFQNYDTPTPETDQLRELRENHIHRATEGDIWELCESLERERDEARILARDWREKWSNDTKRENPPEAVYPFSWENDERSRGSK